LNGGREKWPGLKPSVRQPVKIKIQKIKNYSFMAASV
jgi:hypothetical protein